MPAAIFLTLTALQYGHLDFAFFIASIAPSLCFTVLPYLGPNLFIEANAYGIAIISSLTFVNGLEMHLLIKVLVFYANKEARMAMKRALYPLRPLFN